MIVIGLIVLFGDYDRGKLPQPKVLASSPEGILFELPVVSTTPDVNWKTDWAPGSDDARRQVLQSLSEYTANFKQLRTLLDVWAEPGSDEREKLAQRLGKALAHYNLGRVNQAVIPPAALAMLDSGALLVCAEEDLELAMRMLAALTPYLGGKVTVRFTPELAAQSMRLYLFGTSYFSDLGQAKFADGSMLPSALAIC
ncbi:hypothetical protein DWB85_19190 [Seongchinamella sediminis]|uniref:Uncharacterized protein n=1 Tax=Seongchinamella sediminis TaxID=2283635 RepID=A0A3L7DRU7_9GAMM|nr:hypothetical protein DWB85_19190 [Seongchinamella sediminis]